MFVRFFHFFFILPSSFLNFRATDNLSHNIFFSIYSHMYIFFLLFFLFIVILYSLPMTSTFPHFPLLCVHSSECIGRSGAKNDRAREAGSINQVSRCVRFLYSSTLICDGIVLKIGSGIICRRTQYSEIYCLLCTKYMEGIIQHDAPHSQYFLPLPLSAHKR